MRPPIIGLVGRKRAGKDSVADILVHHYGYNRIAFADKVRDVCKIVFELTDDQLTIDEFKEQPIEHWPFETPRALMQKVGTECFRTVWPDVWLEAVKREIDKNPEERIVITDVRFENELLVSRARGGVNIRIDAAERLGPASDTHASEALADQLLVQHTIDNNGDIHNLYKNVTDLMEMPNA